MSAPEQLALTFDPPSTGHPNSDAAAVTIRPKAHALRERVFQFIRACGMNGATTEEICTAMGIKDNTIRPRVWELSGKDRKRNLPKRIFNIDGDTRPTASGCPADIWRAR